MRGTAEGPSTEGSRTAKRRRSCCWLRTRSLPRTRSLSRTRSLFRTCTLLSLLRTSIVSRSRQVGLSRNRGRVMRRRRRRVFRCVDGMRGDDEHRYEKSPGELADQLPPLCRRCSGFVLGLVSGCRLAAAHALARCGLLARKRFGLDRPTRLGCRGISCVVLVAMRSVVEHLALVHRPQWRSGKRVRSRAHGRLRRRARGGPYGRVFRRVYRRARGRAQRRAQWRPASSGLASGGFAGGGFAGAGRRCRWHRGHRERIGHRGRIAGRIGVCSAVLAVLARIAGARALVLGLWGGGRAAPPRPPQVAPAFGGAPRVRRRRLTAVQPAENGIALSHSHSEAPNAGQR